VALPNVRDREEARRALTAWLAGKLDGAGDVRLSELGGPASNGFSNETLIFDASWTDHDAAHRRSFVVRVQPTSHTVFPSDTLELQHRVMTQLGAHTDVPVPATRWFERDPAVLGAPFLVMDRTDGVAPSDNPPYTIEGWLTDAAPDLQQRLWRSGLDAMAAVHLVDWRAVGLEGTPVQGPAERLEWWADLLAWAAEDRPQPVPEAAVAWLRANVPESDAPDALCWGDSRIGNQLFVDGNVTAILDWEMVHVGDPRHDLGWYIWLDRHFAEGIGGPRLPGFDSYEDTIARWEQRTGRRADALQWFQVLSGLGFAAVMVRLCRLLVEFDMFPADTDFEHTNPACTLLATELERLGAR